MRHIPIHLVLAASCIACAVAAPVANAAPAMQQYTAGAPAACRPALPAYDGAIRTRPTAMANEGTTTAFVSCSNWSMPFFQANYDTVVVLKNNSSVAVNVTCTLVAGGDTGPAPTYSTKTVSLAAQATNGVGWGTLASPDLPGTLRYSCGLPPGVELQRVLWGFVV